MRTIRETAALAGVSVRTLHYYDAIGLLKPSEVRGSEYRYYDDGAVARLQQILFFRGLGLPLREIAALLDRPDYDAKAVLARQRTLLLSQRRQIDAQLAQIDEMIGGDAMQQITQDPETLRRAYAAEAAERWGTTDEYAEAELRRAVLGGGHEAALQAEADEIFAAFAREMDRPPNDPTVLELVRRWQAHITRWCYPCTREILSSLGQMYTADARFAAYFDRFGAGNAQFISQAIAAYCAGE